MGFTGEVDWVVVFGEEMQKCENGSNCAAERERVVALVCKVAAFFEDCEMEQV